MRIWEEIEKHLQLAQNTPYGKDALEHYKKARALYEVFLVENEQKWEDYKKQFDETEKYPATAKNRRALKMAKVNYGYYKYCRKSGWASELALKMAKEIYGYYRYYRKSGWAPKLALKMAKDEWALWQKLRKALGE